MRPPKGIRKHLRLVKAQHRRGLKEGEEGCECRPTSRKLDSVMVSEDFLTGCTLAGIPPSRRQSLKWLRGYGLAREATV